MKPENAAKIRGGATGALIVLLTVMIAVAGVDSVVQTVAAEATGGQSEYRCDYPPAPVDAQSMTPDGRPASAASDHLILPLIIKTDNTGKRLPAHDKARLDGRIETLVSTDNGSLRSSCAEVDPHLARQFTLVGAKPSGTG